MFCNKVMYFLSFSAKYFDVIDKFDWTTRYEVLHTLFAPSVLLLVVDVWEWNESWSTS